MDFTFKPIGMINAPYKEKRGVPIKGIFDPESKGRIDILEAFDHRENARVGWIEGRFEGPNRGTVSDDRF